MSEQTLIFHLTVYDHALSALRDMYPPISTSNTCLSMLKMSWSLKDGYFHGEATCRGYLSFKHLKKRSSRRLSVQATRRRLGLTSWGTIEGSHASRKACYAYARRKERILAHV